MKTRERGAILKELQEIANLTKSGQISWKEVARGNCNVLRYNYSSKTYFAILSANGSAGKCIIIKTRHIPDDIIFTYKNYHPVRQIIDKLTSQ